MGKFLPDPQIVHLRAMRRGDIAVAQVSSAAMVGVAKSAFPSPEGLQSISLSAPVQALGTVDSSISVNLPADGSFPVLFNVAATIMAQDAMFSIGLSGAGSFPEIFFELVTLSGTPSIELETGGTFPALTVTHGTSVV